MTTSLWLIDVGISQECVLMYDQSSSLNKQINQLWLSKIGSFGYFLALFLYLQDMGHSDTKMKFLNI